MPEVQTTENSNAAIIPVLPQGQWLSDIHRTESGARSYVNQTKDKGTNHEEKATVKTMHESDCYVCQGMEHRPHHRTK
ncbi:hypothetical protein [Absidia glauca]|uniref:Uncharacterized protein n=1 Tax=Absidia glauca TaxID=4829 RepID=A0A168L2C5_ABSGL|nr:hypothetical protein [Absidia glauca]